MSTPAGRSSPLSRSSSVSPRTIAAAVILLIAILGWLAYRSFGPLTPPKTFTVKEQRDWVAKLARDTQGDISRVSAADRKKLDSISFGNGARLLQGTFERQNRR